MNDFKFRVWDKEENRFWFFDLQELLERRMSYRGSFDEKIMRGVKEQSTGFHDKNGTLIYGGDVVKINDYEYLVAFSHAQWEFKIISKNIYCYPAFSSHAELCEIISNIHEKEV